MLPKERESKSRSNSPPTALPSIPGKPLPPGAPPLQKKESKSDKKSSSSRPAQPVTYREGHFQRLIHASDKMDQKKFGAQGACGTLCNLYALYRLRGKKPREIIETFRQQKNIDLIVRSHAHAARECYGTALEGMVNIGLQINFETLQYVDYQRCQMPQYRAIGQYPAGFQQMLGEYPVETDDGVWPLLPIPEQSDLSLRRSLLAGLQAAPGGGPLIYIQLRKKFERDEIGHALLLDLSTDHPGIFDPNFGIMALRQGFNTVQLVRLFQSLFEEYRAEADGCIAYQMSMTRKVCGPQPADDPDATGRYRF